MSETVNKLQWFSDNLALLIEDRLLKKSGRSVIMFFDNASIRTSLLGMEDFITETEAFDIRRFGKPQTLVHALAAAGWLGSLQMLLPHQNEFRAQVNLDFGSGRQYRDLKIIAHSFYQALKINKEVVTSEKLKNLDIEARIKFVRENADSAEKLFKVAQFTRGSWRTKLVSWLDTEQLVMTEDDLDLAAIMRGMTYQRLKKGMAIKKKRRTKDLNNSVDAIALSELARKLRLFNSERQPLPVFFSPDGFFEKVIARANLQSRFCYTSIASGRLNVLRGPDYFIFKAIFDAPATIVEKVNKNLLAPASDEELSDLKSRVDLILKAKENLEIALDQATGFRDVPLGHLIDEVKSLSFFEKVWVPFSPKALAEAEEELKEAAEGLRSREFRSAADQALKRAKQEIEDKTRNYKELEELWLRLGKAARELRERIRKGTQGQNPRRKPREAFERHELDPFLHFGLLRFSFPPASHEFIRQSLAGLISDNERLEHDAKAAVVQKFRYAQQSDSRSEELLSELAGILWCLEVNEQLISLLNLPRESTSLSLDLVLAATYFRTKENIGEGNLRLQKLHDEYERRLPREKQGPLMIGLGYLYFHLILCLRRDRHGVRAEIESAYFIKAISYAREAWTVLNEDPKRIYALNCYLYYMVEFGALEYREEMEKAERELKQWMGVPGVWQYRFDDTLARYYWLTARFAQDERGWRFAVEQAREFIDRAWKHAFFDPEVLIFQSTLADVFARGFLPIMQRVGSD